jgi:microcystin-dependent protein
VADSARPSGDEPLVMAAAPVSSPTGAKTFIAVPELVATAGLYPTRGEVGITASFTLAMIQPFAGSMSAYGAPRAQGQLLPIDQPANQALFSVMGTSFGGDGVDDFALPNLADRVAIGGTQIGQMGSRTLTLTYLIAISSPEPPLAGMVALFTGNYAPEGWMIANGTLLPIAPYLPLFQAIGTNFGGNGSTNFALPNLNDAGAVGVGQGPGLPPVSLGEKVSGTVPGLGLNYLISTTGPYPPSSGTGFFPDTGQYLGQMIAYAGAQVPAGWAACDGSLQPISANPALFELIGTTYGGDGVNSFALPDLRGRMILGG